MTEWANINLPLEARAFIALWCVRLSDTPYAALDDIEGAVGELFRSRLVPAWLDEDGARFLLGVGVHLGRQPIKTDKGAEL